MSFGRKKRIKQFITCARIKKAKKKNNIIISISHYHMSIQIACQIASIQSFLMIFKSGKSSDSLLSFAPKTLDLLQ